MPGQLNIFHCVAWLPDGTRLAASGGDGTVSIWDIVTQREVARLKGHTSAVSAIRFLPDGRTLVSVSSSEIIRWRAAAEDVILAGKRSSGKTER